MTTFCEHKWPAGPGRAPCPECRAENEERLLRLDMTALGCVNVALELARTDDNAPLCTRLIAQYAYDLAAAMLEERDRREAVDDTEARLRHVKDFG